MTANHAVEVTFRPQVNLAFVTSVGIDLGERLSSWRTRVEGVGWFRLEKQDEDRPFLITSKPPEHGRSGGGLFSPDGFHPSAEGYEEWAEQVWPAVQALLVSPANARP